MALSQQDKQLETKAVLFALILSMCIKLDMKQQDIVEMFSKENIKKGLQILDSSKSEVH